MTRSKVKLDAFCKTCTKVQFHRCRAPLSLQLYNKHTVAKHVKLISTLLGNLSVAVHNKILACEGRRKHNMAGPWPMEVREQYIHDLEVESR